MARVITHSHWDKARFPEANRLRRCSIPKPECDKLWTAYLHGHEGQSCVTMAMPNYKRPVCVTGMTPEEIKSKLAARVQRGNDQGDEQNGETEDQAE